MQSLINGLAVFSFVGVVILLFGLAALLSMVRGLQQAVIATAPAAGPSRLVPELALPGLHTVALVVSASCLACRERAAHLGTLVDGARRGIRLALVSSDPTCASWVTAGVEAVIDPSIVGRIAPTATPLLICIDEVGEEKFRRLIGSDDDLTAGVFEAGNVAGAFGVAIP